MFSIKNNTDVMLKMERDDLSVFWNATAEPLSPVYIFQGDTFFVTKRDTEAWFGLELGLLKPRVPLFRPQHMLFAGSVAEP